MKTPKLYLLSMTIYAVVSSLIYKGMMDIFKNPRNITTFSMFLAIPVSILLIVSLGIIGAVIHFYFHNSVFNEFSVKINLVFTATYAFLVIASVIWVGYFYLLMDILHLDVEFVWFLLGTFIGTHISCVFKKRP